MLRMPNERQMRVENNREVTGHCRRLEGWQTTAQGGSASPKMLISRPRRNYFSNAFRRTRSSLERAAKVLEAIQTFFDHVEAGGIAEPDRAIRSEEHTSELQSRFD